MKVGLVIYGPLDHRSGGYLYDANIVQHMREQGDTVRVFSLPGSSYATSFLHNLHVGFWRRLADVDLDVLLQDELNHPSLLFGNRWLQRRVDYPIVSIVHHLYADEWAPGWNRTAIAGPERAYLSSVDAVVCNSRATLQRTRRLGLLKPGVVAYPGGDRLGPYPSRAAIRRRAHAPGPLRLLFLGNVIPRKRLGLVLRALARLPRAMWTLSVVGSLKTQPGYAHRMQRLSERLGIGEKVVFHGRLSDAMLRAELQGQHVLALPSRHEGFGIVYLEAMGFGIAVIANKKAPREILQEDTNSLLVEGGSIGGLASVIKALYEDRSLLERLGLGGRDTFDAHPTWNDTGATVRRFLQSLI